MITENNNQRYSVHWAEWAEERYMILLYDRLLKRVIYRSSTKNKQKEYAYIKAYYGEENCIAPTTEPSDLRKYI